MLPKSQVQGKTISCQQGLEVNHLLVVYKETEPIYSETGFVSLISIN